MNKRELETMALYVSLMEEIKIRLEAIDTAGRGGIALPKPLIREFAYLQLRMVVELVSLSCLVAHGDIPATREAKLTTSYKPEIILKELERLHIEFFPVPVSLVTELPMHDGRRRLHFGDIDIPHMEKKRLGKIWSKCGDQVHKGSLKKLLKGGGSDPTDFTEVTAWAEEIRALLFFHRISLLDPRKIYLCTLSNPGKDENVRMVYAEATD
jgi:hypothetical protein